ncbi:MAG TPA: hypothetical protein DEB12_09435 [Porphyromonadaceae bacterium]|nr:hypothetical protein [Porphyromonadaceae bacterium]
MSNAIEEFIQSYSKAIIEGYAAVFAGAGLSVPSGYVSWKQLVNPFAQSIGLSTEKENDYLAITQYYCNSRGNRSRINEEILNAFTKNVSENENIKILTRLPISTYWTTNYDHLIEEGIHANNRRADIKITQDNLATNLYDRDAIVYKMHGDVSFPSQTVLIKDDYETFNFKRGLFTTALKGDLISKTFLFIGFSFEDPNLSSILGRIKALLGENVREHYCFFKKVTGSSEEDTAYMRAKQDLIIQDLGRYGIRSIMLDSYDEITKILREVERRCYLNNVFLSGSMSVDEDGWNIKDAEKFAHYLSRHLVAKDYKITSGFGLGIGGAVINGALDEIMQNKYQHVDEHLRLRPFPQVQSGEAPLPALWTAYRKDMLRECGVAIFIFGNKVIGDKTVLANGMMEEFAIAKEYGARIIPVASTGCTALKIYEEVFSHKEEYPYLSKYWDQLKTSKDPQVIANIIIDVSKI